MACWELKFSWACWRLDWRFSFGENATSERIEDAWMAQRIRCVRFNTFPEQTCPLARGGGCSRGCAPVQAVEFLDVQSRGT